MENKNVNVIQIVMKTALFVSMLISSFVSSFSTFNLIVTMDYGIDLSSMYSAFRYTMPILMAIIYYGLYHVYITLMRGSLNSRMMSFDKLISQDGVRHEVDPCVTFLTLYIAIVQGLFLLFPLYETVLLTILKEIGAGITIYFIHKRLTKNLEKVFDPVIFWALQFSFVVLVLLV